jgi:hypothetical protein
MRRIVVATALMLVLVPGLATAQPRAEEPSVREAVAALFRELVRFVGEGHCGVDPNGGLCGTQPAAPTGDGRCSVDPNGGCAP